MNPFQVREIKNNPFEHCGRMFLRDSQLIIVIDGWGMFEISIEGVTVVLLGLGEGSLLTPDGEKSGHAWLSESGKGFYWIIGKRKFVTPVRRVKKVLTGEHKKAAVFEAISGQMENIAK